MALETIKISTTLVGTTLGTSSRDVGTLCRHTAINKWSRWKPITIPNNLSGATDSLMKQYNFGFDPKTIFIGGIPSGKPSETPLFVWGDYAKPTGGILSPFRLGDFRNYNHVATNPFINLELKNSNGGTVPISGNSQFPQFIPSYMCRLIFNPYTDIKLHEFSKDGINLGNLHLTIVIGGNIGGLSSSESIFAQSDKTLNQAYSDINSDLFVELNTFNVASVIPSNSNIVFVGLFPKATSISQLFASNGISLKLFNNITTTIYNNSYATFGDGNEGGDIPISHATGSWNWLSNQNPTISIDGSQGTMYFSVLQYIMSTGASGQADLRCYIQELNRDFVVTRNNKIVLSTTGEQTIDTSLEIIDIGNIINENSGMPYTSLTCKFHVSSITQGVSTTFNEQNVVIQL